MKKSTIIIRIILIVIWPIAWFFIWEFIKIRFPVYVDEIPYPMRHLVNMCISIPVTVMPYCIYRIVKLRLAEGKQIKKSTIILLFIWPIIWCFIWEFYLLKDMAALPRLMNITIFILGAYVPYYMYKLCTEDIPRELGELINMIKKDLKGAEEHPDDAASGAENEDRE